MKKLISFIFAAGLLFSLNASDIFNFAPLNGKVKSYVQTDFTIASKFGNYFRTPSIKYAHYFNEKGIEIESTELTARDALINKISSVYDDNDNLIEQSCTSADGELIWKTIITYKDNLKVDSSEYDSKGNLKAKIIYNYADGKLVDESGYESEGSLVWKTIYKYNAAGKLEMDSEYTADGFLDNAKIYAYAEDGKLESISSYDSFSNATNKQVLRYSSDGLLNEITTYDNANQIKTRVLYKYDTSNNVNKVSVYDISNKFGGTVNELVSMSEIVYEY